MIEKKILAALNDFPASGRQQLQEIVSVPTFHGIIPAGQTQSLTAQTGKSIEELMLALIPIARSYAYAPISGYNVGAVVQGASGDLILGANVEFPGLALNMTVHGEQTAIVQAMLHGERSIKALAVNGTPCGHCRQFMAEINDPALQLVSPQGVRPLSDALPNAFMPTALGNEHGLLSPVKNHLQIEQSNNSALVRAAFANAERSYAPYSKGWAGVAVKLSEGIIFAAPYLESVAFNPTISPLQAALVTMRMARRSWQDIQTAVLVESSNALCSQEPVTRFASRYDWPRAASTNTLMIGLRRLILLLFLLTGCGLQPITEPRRPDPATEPTIVPTAIAVEKPIYSVARGSVTSQLFKSGRIVPIEQSRLSFALDGQIDALLVSSGDVVEAGDMVAMLDTSGLELALSSAETNLTLTQQQLTIAEENNATNLRKAEINVELAQLDLDFAIEEAGDSPTPIQTLAIEKRKRELELAQLNLRQFDVAVDPELANEIVQIERQIESIKTQIAQSTLVSPISGTVMVVNVDEGDSISAAETVLIIADLERIEVEVTLTDRELQTLAEGLAAVGTNPSRPETAFPMTVRQLPYPYGSGAQGAESFVRIAFDAASQLNELSIGDRVEVAILLENRDSVLWLPPAAIREFNGRLFVVVEDGQTQKRVDIKVGLQNDNQVEIETGVIEGQLVVGP